MARALVQVLASDSPNASDLGAAAGDQNRRWNQQQQSWPVGDASEDGDHSASADEERSDHELLAPNPRLNPP
jgi:hypothetical protein